MLERFFQNWTYATPPVALLLIGLYPLIDSTLKLSVFASLPIYMFHQYEEHDDNRFAHFLNGMMGSEKRGLSARDIWIVNVIFVWFFLLAVFYLSSIDTQWGVLAAYLLAINGVVHILWALKFRSYNPGLWTAIVLFIPGAIWIFSTVPASTVIHFVSAVVVVFLHAGILVAARRPA
ncbi:MAG: HXXEE domain-containing protein [Pseudomonadota bacterium]